MRHEPEQQHGEVSCCQCACAVQAVAQERRRVRRLGLRLVTLALFVVVLGGAGWQMRGFFGLRFDKPVTVGPYSLPESEGMLGVTGSGAGVQIARRTLTDWPISPAAGDRYQWYNPDASLRLWTQGTGDLLTVTSTGLLGVGTTGPSQKLSVNGTVYSTAGGFKFPDGTVQSTASTGGGSPQMMVQIFTSSGTFNVPAGVTQLDVELVGGGGGGSGNAGPPASINGTDSTFLSLVAGGGQGPVGGGASVGGSGGTVSGGYLAVTGQAGENREGNTGNESGDGGSSPLGFGVGGRKGPVGGNGGPGFGFGAGGAGKSFSVTWANGSGGGGGGYTRGLLSVTPLDAIPLTVGTGGLGNDGGGNGTGGIVVIRWFE